MRPMVTSKFEARSSSGAKGAQRPQMKAQTRIFNLIEGEAQIDPNSVIGITVIFYLLVRVLSIFGSNRSFVSFALHCMSIESYLS